MGEPWPIVELPKKIINGKVRLDLESAQITAIRSPYTPP
jgi:hypothetical protein